jgi:hypothetical protein
MTAAAGRWSPEAGAVAVLRIERWNFWPEKKKKIAPRLMDGWIWILLLLSRSLPRAGRREADARLRPPRCPVAGEPAEPSRTATARLDLYGF